MYFPPKILPFRNKASSTPASVHFHEHHARAGQAHHLYCGHTFSMIIINRTSAARKHRRSFEILQKEIDMYVYFLYSSRKSIQQQLQHRQITIVTNVISIDEAPKPYNCKMKLTEIQPSISAATKVSKNRHTKKTSLKFGKENAGMQDR